ncbi:hypothetical protein ALP75_203693 [Pseudomonas syringae pv. actinidiae]|nr:hypothetical protein ALP75_203693 [Pseudomonas syringae pv. actinidiae]
MGQQDNRQIGPGGLVAEQRQQRIDIPVAQRFVGNNRQTGPGGKLLDQLEQVSRRCRRVASFIQNAQGNLTVAAPGGQNDRAFRQQSLSTH